jgi:hypothetical protein
MNKIITFLLLTLFPILLNAQKVFIVFNLTTGVPEELTLVDSNGVKIGYSNFYNSKGILTMSLMYKNGVPDGQWTRYDDKTGIIKESFTYVNGKLNGAKCIYDADGRIAKTIVYADGIRLNFRQTENLWALEVVAPPDAGCLFRFVSVCPAQSYISDCAVYTTG